MKKIAILTLFTFVAILSQAQVAAKYLKGAVPEENGKVVFKRNIKSVNNLDKQTLFKSINEWAKINYDRKKDSKQAVLLTDAEKGSIACMGDQYLVFADKALMLDRASIYYQLILDIRDGECDALVRSIKYDYEEDKNIPAEDMITDKVALRGENKLYPRVDKFRILTIDSLNNVFDNLDKYINGTAPIATANTHQAPIITTATPTVVPQAQTTSSNTATTNNNSDKTTITENIKPTARQIPDINTSMPGFRNLAADKIPGNYIKLLSEPALVTFGQNNAKVSTSGALGVFKGKPAVYTITNNTISIKNEDTYTISFYTEVYKDSLSFFNNANNKVEQSGLTLMKTPTGTPTFAEAWLIIECRNISVNKDNNKSDSSSLYIGEILNVWVK